MVPDIVMDCLEVPLVLSGQHIQRDDRIAEKICALSVAAVIAGHRRRERHVQHPALLVEREIERPGVRPAAVLPAVVFPGVMPKLARLRHRAEFPDFCAGARIEGARISRRNRRRRRRVRADDEEIFVHERHRVVRHAHVHFAVFAESRFRRTGFRVERNQPAAHGKDDARGRGALARPVADAAP